MTGARGAAEPGPASLQRNTRWLVAGNVSYAVGQWLQLAIVARTGGPAGLGQYAFALALTAPVMAFANLQLRTVLVTDERRRYAFAEFRRLRAVATALGLAGVVVAAAAARDRSAVWSVLLPVAAMRAIDVSTDLFHALWQRAERMSVIGISLVLNASASTVLMALAVAVGTGVPGAAVAGALGSLAALLFVRLRTAQDHALAAELAPAATPPSLRRLWRLTAEALPLGVIVLLGSLQQNLPRYFVESYAGPAALGLFAAATQLPMAGNIVVAALGSASTPRFTSLRAAGDQPGFRALARRGIAVAAAIGIAGTAFSAVLGRRVLELLYGRAFGAGAPMLVVASAAMTVAFVAAIHGYALTAARAIAIQPVLLGAAIAALAGVAFVLVRVDGPVGAAWAMLVGYAVQAVASELTLRRLPAAGSPPPRREASAASTGA